MVDKKKKLEKITEQIWGGIDKAGDTVIKGIKKMDRALDKIGFGRIDPMDLVGGKRPAPVRPRPTRREVMWCPVCNAWVTLPHRHKIIDTGG